MVGPPGGNSWRWEEEETAGLRAVAILTLEVDYRSSSAEGEGAG